MTTIRKKIDKSITPEDNQMRKNIDIMFTRYRLPYDSSGEKALWQSVIIQAALDIFSNSKCPKAIRAKKQALSWFKKSNADFVLVCSFAELDPDYVVRSMKRALHHFQKKKAFGCQHSLDQDPHKNQGANLENNIFSIIG
jgi:hypothetical protein